MDSPAPGSREEQNALSFLDALVKEAGHELRPVSYLTMQNIALLDLSFCRGEEARKAMTKEQLRDELNVYLFIQAAPGVTVSRAIRAYRKAIGAGMPREEALETFLCESVEPFLGTLPMEKKTS